MENTNTSEEIYPIAVLIDELKNDDIVQRLNSIRRLNTIATALGETRTRDELIPYLCQSTDDEDEVLMALADELGKFVPLVGGPQFAHSILDPLERLAMVEETVVREKAVESLNMVSSQMTEDAIVSHFVPLIKRLAAGEWFSTRVSACGLFAVAYNKCPITIRKELREAFAILCRDETPMVRRAAAQGLGPLVKVAEMDIVRTQLMELLSSLVRDEQDSVRLITVESCSSFALILNKEDASNSLVPLIQRFAQDESWRVRYNVSLQMVLMCKNLGEEITRQHLVQSLAKLLQDNEAEVRVISAGNISSFARLLDGNLIVKHIIPCVKELAQDASQLVRSALAQVVMELAPCLGRTYTIDYLLPVFLQLLRDPFAEVRLNVISKLDEVNSVVGVQLLTDSLLPAIAELSKDKHWRVRMAILQKMPMLAQQLGVQFFEQKSDAFQLVNWLDDQVASIRDTAASELQEVAKVLGWDWTRVHLLPHLTDKIKHPNYLNRITILKALAILIQVLPKDQVKQNLLPVMLKCADDSVPNVRFNVAKLLIRIHKSLEKDLIDGVVKSSLQKLTEDSDADVKYFAQEALDTICG